MTRKICVMTGTRAEYGILYWVLKEIQARSSLELQLLVTGMHMSPEFGLTYQQIEKDGFSISEKIEILMSADSETATSTSIGLGIMRFSTAFQRLRPDMLVVLGDRIESLAAAIAAMVARIPIAHIAGGQSSEGAIDEAIRHSITKMGQLHFTSLPVYRDRIVQMGEDPERVFLTGTPSLDGIRQMTLLNKQEMESRLDFDLSQPTFLVVYHPVTLEDMTAGWQMDELLATLDQFRHQCVFVMPNSDTGGRIIIQKIQEFTQGNHKAKAFINLERELYLNLMRYADVMVSNSSSGIVEAFSFELPVVNIGDRQRGRRRFGNVIDCDYDRNAIMRSIRAALEPNFRESIKGLANPHGDGHSSKRIVDLIESAELGEGLLKKKFHDVSPKGAFVT